MEFDKMKMQTRDGVADNISWIAEKFPNCVTEKIDAATGDVKLAVDFDVLRQELSCEVVEGKDERYQFVWPDKKKAILLANAPINATLRPCEEESEDFANTQNLYIEGDNLDVMKCLKETYLGKVKMIYIDPPYNTGNDFIYNDDFAESVEDYLANSGQYDEQGNRLFSNLESSGRFHTDWLNMIFPRLKQARDLLTDDGVIFISIDDKELQNLKMVCDEIFSESNYINLISISTKNTAGASGGGEDKRLKKNLEYILIYAKDYKAFKGFNKVYVYKELSELICEYKNEGSSWKYTSVLIDPGMKEYVGSTVDGEGQEIKIFKRISPVIKSVNQLARDENVEEKEIYKKYGTKIFQTTNAQTSIRDRVISYRSEFDINEDLLSIEYIPRSGKNKGKIYEQFYKGEKCRLFVWLRDTSEIKDGILYKRDTLGTLWDVVGETKNLTKEGGVAFPNGKKPVYLLNKLCQMQTANDDIILDFFSGSSTTAHAVMQANSEDNAKRKFIMIQIPEKVDSETIIANDNEFENICEIGKERIRRAAKKIKEETGADIDYGFRVLKLDSTNMEDVYYAPADVSQQQMELFADNVKPGRTSKDLLFQTMLEHGATLDSKIEETEISGKVIYNVADGYLVACFDTEVSDDVVKAIAQMQPQYAVLRDSSLADDSTATNFEQIFKTYSPTTTCKIL